MATITVGSGKDYSTIQAGVSAANDGDTVEVYAGTYNETIDFDASVPNITLKQVGGEAVTWNLNAADHGIFYNGNAGTTVQDFNDINLTTNTSNKYVVYMPDANGAGATLKDCDFDCGAYTVASGILAWSNGSVVQDINYTGGDDGGSGHGAFNIQPVSGGDGGIITIQRCIITDVTGAGMCIQPNTGDTHNIYNCIIDTPSTYGIYNWSTGPGGAENIYNCTVYNAGTVSYDFYSTGGVQGTTVTFKNCVSDSPGTCHVAWDTDWPSLTSDYNVGYNAGTAWSQINTVNKTFAEWKSATGGDANSYDTDPGLTDPANDDFTLDGSGSAHDVGVDLSGTFTDDFAGTTRTTPWDIGAYDYVAAVVAAFASWKGLTKVGG